ncbi:hypothetical protein QUF76_18935 [Desulfobacterales bacterium HSG16]|nr:hypothetical protein [Desulfobacterales bacterium HSG16]
MKIELLIPHRENLIQSNPSIRSWVSFLLIFLNRSGFILYLFRKVALTENEKKSLDYEISELDTKLSETIKNFEQVASGVDLESFTQKSHEEFDWKNEIVKILEPLVQGMNKITARPRKIEKIRNEIVFLENQDQSVKKALANIKIVLSKIEKSDKNLKKELSNLENSWKEKESQIGDRITVSRYQLDELLQQGESLFESSQTIFKSFLKNRGQNFVLSLLAFLTVYFFMRLVHRFIYRFSPIHKKGGRTLIIRLFDVSFQILTITGSIGALLIVLYVSGDWLLISIAIIFLVGITWTAKEGLPLFWRQVQLMLNFGTVRENERLVYNGVPWRVRSLSINAILENPAFKPESIRIPLKDVIGLNSRIYHESEPWFPCNVGDWVILRDKTRGMVISQTFEMVQLVLRGGSTQTFLTTDFLKLSPINISNDFRLKVIFGFDYGHQAALGKEIPEKLKDILICGLSDMGFAEDIIQLKVEIECAGPSSIDLVIIADFSGKIAALYNSLKRAIQRLTIDACTANEWDIPFPQITVHTPETLLIQNDKKESP